MKLRTVLFSALLSFGLTLPTHAADNLLSNGDFEEASTNFLFGADFTDWSFGAQIAIETADVQHGEKAFRTVNVSQTRSLIQQVDMQNEVVGQEFELTIHYKTITANEGDIFLNSQWDCVPAQTGTPHDSAKLNQVLPLSSEWKELKFTTTKPTNGTTFNVSIGVKRGAIVLFDNFTLTRTENTQPWFTVLPEKINSTYCNIGDSVLMATLTVRQGNLTTPVRLEVTGTCRSDYKLEKTQVTAAEETVRLWFAPTTIGIKKGNLIIECDEALSSNTTRTLHAVATDSTLTPEITLSPESLPAFSAKAGETREDTITVTAMNCVDYVRVSCQNAEVNGAFRINTSFLPRNAESKICVTFNPSQPGSYSATLTFTTEGATTKTMTLTGTATEADKQAADWSTDFSWDTSSPLTLLKENFDTVSHNKTLLLQGWQNVVRQGARPWWGYTDTNNDGERCAKATAYIWGQTDSTLYDMWLVTPALDYKNAKNQVFTFRVRGDYVRDGQSAKLQLYYIDATDPKDLYQQDLNIEMPATEDQAGDWLDFQVNLAGQENIADAFFMAFRFTGYSGNNGAATYLIDDVSWGRDDLPLLSADSAHIIATTGLNEKKIFAVTVQGKNLTEAISVSVTGNNASKFKVAPATLPSLGGVLGVEFQSDQEGVHEAYLRIRSRGAVDLYIPMAVLVKANTAIDATEAPRSTHRIVLRGHSLYIETPNGTYSIDGRLTK